MTTTMIISNVNALKLLIRKILSQRCAKCLYQFIFASDVSDIHRYSPAAVKYPFLANIESLISLRSTNLSQADIAGDWTKSP